MKKTVNISSIVFAFACYNNASGMLVKYIKPQPHIMQQKRILCTMTPMAHHQMNNKPTAMTPTHIHNRYILSEHRATSAVSQLSEETYQQLQKLFDRNNAAIEAFPYGLPSLKEQNIAIWRYTFYGKKLDVEKLSALEELAQRDLKILNSLNTNTERE